MSLTSFLMQSTLNLKFHRSFPQRFHWCVKIIMQGFASVTSSVMSRLILFWMTVSFILKGQHCRKLRRFWWHWGGQLVSCHIFCVHTHQSSEFLSEVRANRKGSLPQGQHQAKPTQLNISCGRVEGGGQGGGFSLCDTQINFWKSVKIHLIAQHFGHEGLVMKKMFNYIVEGAWIKLSIPFYNF